MSALVVGLICASSTVRSVDNMLLFDRGRLVGQGDYASLRDQADSHFSLIAGAQTL